MVHDLLMQILLLIITVAVPWFTLEVIKWVRAKSKNEKFKHFLDLALVGVRAAEEKLGSGTGAAKKKQVELYLANKLKWITSDDIDKIIDATVNAINKPVKGDK